MSLQQTRIQGFTHIFLFLFCELIAFILLVNFNQKQREIFLHSSSIFSGSILRKTAQIGDYMSLQKSNEDLLRENARLLDEIINMPRANLEMPDSTVLSYSVIPARIINNNISSLRNLITLDKGQTSGIQSSMGVVTIDGVVGIVRNNNENFSSVLSLLNTVIRVSASVENQNHFGTITWNGYSYNSLSLSGIPIHANISIGDQVVTNGYSTIFPEGLPIGLIKSYDYSKDGAFYEIEVKPHVDFTKIDHVYVLKDNFAKDKISLESNE